MLGVLIGSGLLAVWLTLLIVGVVRLAQMLARRVLGRTETLTAERRFAEAVAGGDFDRAELQARVLLGPPAALEGRPPDVPPKPAEEPGGGSTLLLPPPSDSPSRRGRCPHHGMAGGCRRCRPPGRGHDAA